MLGEMVLLLVHALPGVWLSSDAYLKKHSLDDSAVTESQNHGMFGVGRDLCGSSSPTLLPKKGHLQQAAQDLVQGIHTAIYNSKSW